MSVFTKCTTLRLGYRRVREDNAHPVLSPKHLSSLWGDQAISAAGGAFVYVAANCNFSLFQVISLAAGDLPRAGSGRCERTRVRIPPDGCYPRQDRGPAAGEKDIRVISEKCMYICSNVGAGGSLLSLFFSPPRSPPHLRSAPGGLPFRQAGVPSVAAFRGSFFLCRECALALCFGRGV